MKVFSLFTSHDAHLCEWHGKVIHGVCISVNSQRAQFLPDDCRSLAGVENFDIILERIPSYLDEFSNALKIILIKVESEAWVASIAAGAARKRSKIKETDKKSEFQVDRL
jgi:hypothetical protein